MFGLGVGELLVIFGIAAFIFGAGKLPQIGEGFGKAISGFAREVRKVGRGEDDDERTP